MAQGIMLHRRRGFDKAFRATISVTSGQNYTCSVGNVFDGIPDLTYTHDYGDGTVMTGQTPNFSHVYENAGIYNISITPEQSYPITLIYGNFKTITNWGNTSLRLDRYTMQLRGIESVPNVPLPIHSNATEINSLFQEANLKSLPSNFFSKCGNVTEASHLFNQATFETLPNGIFDSLVNLKKAPNMFNGATFGTLPVGIFDKLVKIETVERAFNGASFDSLPERLFWENIMCSNYYGTFGSTKGFKLPDEMFNYPAIQSLQADMRLCFGSPRTTSHTGTAYPLWNYTNQSFACYSRCFDLDNYNEIPDDWK